jgi:hypothetical protein
MRAFEARANPPSPAAQAIAPFFKGGWKGAAQFDPFEKWGLKDAPLFDPLEKWSWKGAALFDPLEKWSWKDAVLFTPFEKGGEEARLRGTASRADERRSAVRDGRNRHRAAMTGGFALRAPLTSSAL